MPEHPDRKLIEELVFALTFVKRFFRNLERGTPADDPLRQFRERFHKPVHDQIDPAMTKGKQWLKNH